MDRLIAALVVLVVAATMTIGCGGDSGATDSQDHEFSVLADTTVTTGSLPKGAFIAQVNDLCRRKWQVILHNFVLYSGWLNPRWSKERRFANAVRLSYMAGVDFHIFDDIFRLGAPVGEQRDVENVIGPMQEAVERGQRQVRITSNAQLEALFDNYNQAARRYGLNECLVEGQHLPPASA